MMVLAPATPWAADPAAPAAEVPEPVVRIFQPFAELLAAHVVSAESGDEGRIGAFDYPAALDRPDLEARLTRQDELLAAFDPSALTTREQALAFWINAYNYFMIAHVLRAAVADGELVDGVKDFGSLFRPYAVFGRSLFEVGKQRYSLDEIEKETLFGEAYRKRGWFDPRVHFAVNCASVGCPPLRAELYRPDRIDRQLDANTRSALASTLHLRIDGGTVLLSRLFDWYEDDFGVGYESVTSFVTEFVPPETARAVRAADRTRYIDYDWRLNRPSNFYLAAR